MIRLRKCPKEYILETHRSRSPASTLELVRSLKETAGVQSFREITNADRLGIPAFSCVRVRPDRSTTTHTGKGVSGIQAQVSLIMESVERYSSEYRDEYSLRLKKGSHEKVGADCRALDPLELIPSAFGDYRPDSELYWVPGYEIGRSEEILVPACAVYHPFHLDPCTLIATNTNGIASGNTIEEAVFHALTEVIERDAWSIAKYNREMNDTLTVEDRPGNGFIIELIERFEKAEIEVTAKDLTTDVGVPVIGAFSHDLVHPDMMPMDGFGAHLDPRVAMARALLELAVTRALFVGKYGVDGLRETVSPYLNAEGEEDFRFYAYQQKGLDRLPSEYTDDILDDITMVLERLRAAGLGRAIVVDLTRPDTGVPTVRVIVPGMEAYCFDRGRRGARLLDSNGTGRA